MHSCSIIMAAGSHGSTYYGGVPLRPLIDRSSSNAIQASYRHERRVWRDLSGQPRSLSWPSQNPLPRTSTLKHCKLPCLYTNRAAFALISSALHHTAAQQRHFASDARCIAFGERQSPMACGLHEPSAHASLPLPRAAAQHCTRRARPAKRIDANTQAPCARSR